MKRILTVMAAVAVAGAGLGVAQPATAANKYTACVKKSTGEMRLLPGKKKKCGKGWKRTTWTKSGPRGDQGSQGAPGPGNSMGAIVDGNGAAVGEALSITTLGPYPVFTVRIDGGVFTYLGNGWLYFQNPPVHYDNAACTGTPFIQSDGPLLTSFIINDPTFRAVYRPTSPALGPATAWKPTGQKSSVVAASTWYRNDVGACVAGAAFSGERIALTQVPAPPDRQGPLRLS